MSETNKSYRIRTTVGDNTNVHVNLNQQYDTFEILSLKLGDTESYRLMDANYGVVVGRVLASNGFGIENAKLSIFISADTETMNSVIESQLYPYQTTTTKRDNIKYNLLTDEEIDNCHTVVGNFPNKNYVLDNGAMIEVFDKYYKYTVRTNYAGDYMICGVPTGQHTLHMDLDLSDCGILSQKPRDFVYKGYTIEQFENPNQFKSSDNLGTLSQIVSQDLSITVIPFWGNGEENGNIGITRQDIDVNFKFEPTAVFMGCIVGDNASNGISKKCVPSKNMGAMDELTTGEGTIEMIRKTIDGTVEEFQVKGTEVINGNGVWCYQIPMNLDYVMHDEYGNIVPTNNPEKGIPTRAKVRFRVSMNNFDDEPTLYYRAKVLVPHNPKYANTTARTENNDSGADILDYNFGTKTDDNSFRDLTWNNVYTVKSYIPRFQKSQRYKDEKFTGIKHCNIYGQNNPIPYNNIRIRMPLMFTILCSMIKSFIRIVEFTNSCLNVLAQIATNLTLYRFAKKISMIVLQDGLCPDLEGWYFAPSKRKPYQRKGTVNKNNTVDVAQKTYKHLIGDGEDETDGEKSFLEQIVMYIPLNIFSLTKYIANLFKKKGEERETVEDTESDNVWNENVQDESSVDDANSTDDSICLTSDITFLLSCVEMNLANEYKVMNFDFYNDWINGMIYMPRWMRTYKRGKNVKIYGTDITLLRSKVKSCMSYDSENIDDEDIKYKAFRQSRRYTQQCSLKYELNDGSPMTISSKMDCGCDNGLSKTVSKITIISNNKQVCHKKDGLTQEKIFGKKNGGIVHAAKTMKSQYVYYFKPCEWNSDNKRVNLFANDIVLLGSLNDCSTEGIPQVFRYLSSSTYKMPSNLAQTNMESEGYLYSISGNSTTICNGKSNFIVATGETTETTGITTTQQTFTATSEYFSYSGSDTNISYETNGVDDYMALTEIAGISWNYTGPDQFKLNTGSTNSFKFKNAATSVQMKIIDIMKDNEMKNKYGNIVAYLDGFYQPGGHFLGLSCFNSQTNIKSCVNLSRACELGVEFSQRREIPRTIENNIVKYTYLVPTGLISKHDIVGTDVRSMFATLNHNKLIAKTPLSNDGTNTGYYEYNFTYLRPNNFNGELKDIIKEHNAYYNNQLVHGTDFTVEDWMIRDADTEIEAEANDIKNNTYRRTIEDGSVDYYKFRMGIDNLRYDTQKNKFYSVENKKYYSLPQYENSFYFYFGLKDGATALDELNKEFFSTCVKDNDVDIE